MDRVQKPSNSDSFKEFRFLNISQFYIILYTLLNTVLRDEIEEYESGGNSARNWEIINAFSYLVASSVAEGEIWET
jgi:hypothetical protein